MNKIRIVVDLCVACGAPMTVSAARVENDGETGVLEFTCSECGEQVMIIAVIETPGGSI